MTFFDKTCLREIQVYNRNHAKKPNSQEPADNQPRENWISWNGFFENYNNGYAERHNIPDKVYCHMKILAPQNTKIKANAFVYDPNHPYHPEPGQPPVLYGSREDCINPQGFVCLEVRPAKMIARDLDNVISESFTRITVRANSPLITLTSINPSLMENYGTWIFSDVGDSYFEVSLVAVIIV